MWKIFDTAPTSDYHTPTFNRKSGIGVPEYYGAVRNRQSHKATFFITENQQIKGTLKTRIPSNPSTGCVKLTTPLKSSQ